MCVLTRQLKAFQNTEEKIAKEKFKSGIFSVKTHRMVFVHIMLEKFQNATITGHFVFVSEEDAALFRRLGLPSTLISYENLFKRKKFENAGFLFSRKWKTFWERSFSKTM